MTINRSAIPVGRKGGGSLFLFLCLSCSPDLTVVLWRNALNGRGRGEGGGIPEICHRIQYWREIGKFLG